MPKYLVWQADCYECGTVVTYGEDESSAPDECEECGADLESDG